MAPVPVESGFLSGAANPAAAEWVHARLMGFDPESIPLIRHSFDRFTYPIAEFGPEGIVVRMAGSESAAESVRRFGPVFRPAAGWAGHCEEM